VLVEVGFSYCSKKKCGGFADANFDSWFPYTDDQRIYLLSNKNDRDTLDLFHNSLSLLLYGSK
jgi:hypothetical protein